MTKTKSTKRALLMSALALLMCVSMLIGSTFAWFTDSVTSGGNTIQSGTLKVDLVNAAGESLAGQQLTFKTADNRAQDQILWEPGCTYEIDPVFVKNNGNLALKYQIVINGIDGDAKLLEAIEWKVMYGTGEDAEELDLATFEGHLDTNGALSEAIVLVGHMKEEANNDYQGLTADGISITVYATQYTYENDSFNNQYDKDAEYPVVVANATELADAIAAGKNVVLVDDIALTEGVTVPAGANVALDLNGNNITGTFANPVSMITNNGALTIEGEGNIAVTFNGTVNNGVAMNAISNKGNLTINGGTISNTGTSNQIGYAIDNYHGSTLTINGGEITASGSTYYDAIRLFCGATNETVVTVNGGKISTIWAQNPSTNKATEVKGTVVVNGGDITTVYYENYTTVKVADGVTTTVSAYGAGSDNATSASVDGYTVYSFVNN